VSEQRSFDYVIVGSGPAGCVLANRLSARPDLRVLLLEAGGSDLDYPQTQEVGLPALFDCWGPDTDWGFATEIEPNLNQRSMPILQGKVVGGGSSTNGRIHIRGNRKDYDHWNYLGNEGWGYDDLLPYFKKSEDYKGRSTPYQGTGGPVTVIDLPAPSPASEAFVQAAIDVLRLVGPVNLNEPRQENAAGFSQSTTTTDLKRCGAAQAYLHPILGRRANLDLQVRAFVTRILFEGRRAVGVEYVQDGQVKQARAECEVMVCAGAFQSPKLLMLSGIGPARQLAAHGIPVRLDLPGVGQNLQDHLLVRMSWTSLRELPAPIIISEANLFTHTRAGLSAASPDLQCLFGPFVFPTPEYSGPGFTMVPSIERGASVGSVELRSGDPLAPPLIRPEYLSTEIDMQILLHGLALGRELVAASSFKGLVGRELLPGPDVQSEQDLRAYIRETSITEWHPSCSCRMGHDALAVVDPQLRVHGMEALRVVDSSVMPTIINANLQATIFMIGEKAADLVLSA
jgi:choline dehydrogenase